MTRVCVFCGSAYGRGGKYREAARDLGKAIVRGGASLIYGGGAVGIMRELAEAVLEDGGYVIGVVPRETLGSEEPYKAITELRLTDTVCERKMVMESLSDAFVGFPGGVGTLEEILSVWSRRRMHLHAKPVGLLNIEGYFDDLVRFVETAEAEGFIRANDRALLHLSSEPERLLQALMEEATQQSKSGKV